MFRKKSGTPIKTISISMRLFINAFFCKFKHLLSLFMNELVFVLIFIFLPSSPLQTLIGKSINIIYPFAILIISIYLLSINRLKLNVNLFTFAILIVAIYAGLIAEGSSQFKMGIILLIMIMLAKSAVPIIFRKRSVNFLYFVSVIILIGAWISFFYAYFGGTSLFVLLNPDGRPNYLFLTSFTNSAFQNIIRPSGVFDEPGALSFFTTLVICINELCGGQKNRSFILFFLGLITFSLTHVICFLLYIFYIFKKQFFIILILLILLFSFATNFIPKDAIIQTMFLSRLTVTPEGRIAGDNRSNQVSEFFSLLSKDISIRGNNVNAKTIARKEIDQSSNPFSIWYGYGLIIWLPYAFFIFVLLYYAFVKRKEEKLVSILLLLLLLQRPYIYSMYWGFSIWFVISLMLYKNRFKFLSNAPSKYFHIKKNNIQLNQ